MATIYFSNTWDIITGNTWIDISDYAIKIPDLAITERNDNFSPKVTSLTIQLDYGTPASLKPSEGDRIKIEFGDYAYFGYADVVEDVFKKAVIQISTVHYLSRLKDLPVNRLSLRTLFNANPYSDNVVTTLNSITYLGLSVRTILGCMIKIACPDMFILPTITGVDYKRIFASIIYEGDFFHDYYQDSEMLYMLSHEKCGTLYKATDEYQDDIYVCFDFLSDICRFTEANIFTYADGSIKFHGDLRGFDYLETLTETNLRYNYEIDITETITDSFSQPTYSKRYKHSQLITSGTSHYYATPIKDVVDTYDFPNRSETFLDKNTDINIPANLLLRYQYYTGGSNALLDTSTNVNYYRPFGTVAMILAKNWYETDGYINTKKCIQKRSITVLGIPTAEKSVLSAKYSISKGTTKISQQTILDI